MHARCRPECTQPSPLPACRSPELCSDCDPTGKVCFRCMAPHVMMNGVCKRCYVSGGRLRGSAGARAQLAACGGGAGPCIQQRCGASKRIIFIVSPTQVKNCWFCASDKPYGPSQTFCGYW